MEEKRAPHDKRAVFGAGYLVFVSTYRTQLNKRLKRDEASKETVRRSLIGYLGATESGSRE